ncbi:MAG: ATP-binding protein [Cytophagales bacterium]|nr:ATP-binding protein [Cytophagales bacterium]
MGRTAFKKLEKKFFRDKAIIVIGPRQVGKTTLIEMVLKKLGQPALYLNGDDPKTLELLTDINTEQMRQLIGDNKVVFIDEAQRIPNSGITSKIIVDQFKDVQLLLSGSSAFELNQLMQEPLTGRKWTFHLFPISWQEYQANVGFLKAEQTLENFLVFGGYPDVLNHPNEAQEVLQELTDSYLFKDVLHYTNIKKPTLIVKLVQALAHQIGSEVSYSEIGQLIGLDSKTVSHYIDVLEQAYVVFRLPPFSRNLRNEIKSKPKIYFYDNGIRNAVIGQFEPIKNRNDVGALWENFLLSERLKYLSYNKLRPNSHFWRTKQQQEVDYVEDSNEGIFGFEFKWNTRKPIRFPKTFTDTYKSTNLGITPKNFREFVMSAM